MNKRVSAVVASGMIIMSSLANPAWADPTCLPAKGKIANNAQPVIINGQPLIVNGQPVINTLGVAALNMGGQKFKCAISGDAQASDPNAWPPEPNYRHTLVCDDKVDNGEPQSQITLNTFFVSPPAPTGECPQDNPFGPASFTFEELSTPDPDPSTARGAFVGVDPLSSVISITGDFNCKGGINMKFQGWICFTE